MPASSQITRPTSTPGQARISSRLTATHLGTWPAGAVHTYRFTVTFDGSGGAGADNRYQGSSLTIGFRWTAS